MKNLSEANNRLKWLWSNGRENGIKPNDEKIVIIETSNFQFFDGTKAFIGQLQFDRWSDREIFFDVVNGRYKPNKIGEKYGVTTRNVDGGSAYLGFNPAHYKEVEKILKENKWNVFLKLEEDKTNTVKTKKQDYSFLKGI